ncbi:MAG: hypothetical protein WAK93_19765 [Solirubrobacteraceae bacterium]
MDTDRPRRGRRRGPVILTDRDRRLLEFAAENRLVLAGQVGALLGISAEAATARVRTLRSGGYLESEQRLTGEPRYHQISREGLRAIGSSLPAPKRADLSAYRHDVGVGWLMLVARGGLFGSWREVTSERHMRSHDLRPDREGEPFGIRLGGVGAGAGGRPRLHYPDLSMVTGTGHRVAFELELTSKSRRRREDILTAYATDRRIAAVVYLVDDPAVGRALRESVRRLGIGWLVRVQAVQWGSEAGPVVAGRAARRALDRPRDAGREAASNSGRLP